MRFGELLRTTVVRCDLRNSNVSKIHLLKRMTEELKLIQTLQPTACQRC